MIAQSDQRERWDSMRHDAEPPKALEHPHPQPPNGGVWTVAQGDLWEPWVHCGTPVEPPKGAILLAQRRRPSG